VNVDHRLSGTSVVAVRVLLAGLVLLAAGCVVLGWGSRSRQSVAKAAAVAVSQSQFPLPASPLAANEPSQAAAAQAQSRAVSFFGGLPLMFEPNQGQANLDQNDSRVRFLARGKGYAMTFGPEGAAVSLLSRPSGKHDSESQKAEPLRMKLVGADQHASVTGAEPLPGKTNYFLGNDPSKWRHDVPQFAQVRYEDIYPGINLVFYGNQGRLEYDFQVAPGSDPAQAELEFDGAKRLELAEGNLIIKGEAGDVRLEAPRVYQEIAGQQQAVEGSFVLRAGNRVGFALGAYDHSQELVIDPVLTFSTYFGGTGDEHSPSIAVDGSGNIYLAGSTTSPNLPVATGLLQTTLRGAQNVFIAKITPAQTNGGTSVLDYVTYLGGTGTDSSAGIGVDGAGDVFVAGTTSSTDFPTTANTAYQTGPEPGSTGATHVFVSELQFDATKLLYSSYLSGNGADVASGMTIDAKGYIYVTGTTTSTDTSTNSQIQFPASGLPQAQPFQSASRGPSQFFVTKVNTASAKSGSITYSTYFGGTNFVGTTLIANGGGITVDTNGNIYFTGTTNYTYTGCQGCQTTDFPILNAYQPCLDQPTTVVIVNPATCSNATSFSTPDAFVAKLNPNSSAGTGQLLWSTYVGGSQSDSGTGIALDTGAANVYITGTTNSPDVTALTTFGAYQLCLDTPLNPAAGTACPTITAPGPNDAFVARLSNPATSTIATNVSLTYFSYLGGTGNEAGLAIAVDTASGALITGWTQSTDFPVFPNPNSIQSTLNGTQDAFLARLNTVAVTGQTTTGSYSNFFGGTGVDQGTGIAIDANSNTYLAGDTNSVDLQVSSPYQATNGGGYDAFAVRFGTATNLRIKGVLTLGTNQTYISAGNQATFTYTLTNGGPDLASNITILDDISLAATGIPVTFVSAATTSGTCSTAGTSTSISCSIPSLQADSTATITIVLTPTPTTSGGAAKFNGGSVQVIGPNNIIFAQTTVPANMSDFGLDINPKNLTLQAAGDTAVFTATLTPTPVYGTNISLSCSSGVPAQASCNFTTTPVTLQSSSPGTSTLNLTTTARPVPIPAMLMLSGRFYGMWLVVPGLALLGSGAGNRRRRLIGALFLLALFPLLLLQPACSGTTTQPVVSGTPAGTYTIVVTATSGSDTKNQSFTLTVP
jgi:Domain of unknown function DUF11/Beta-propeller repeat